MISYNFIESLNRIDGFLSADTFSQFISFIPKPEESLEKAAPVCATIMYVKLRNDNPEEKLFIVEDYKLLQAFLSEATCICSSNECCHDIIVSPDSIEVVYSTPQKANVDAVIDDAARVNSLSMVINKKYQGRSRIHVSIGIDYGHVVRVPISAVVGSCTYTWIGSPVFAAKKCAEDGLNGVTSISDVVWNNIRIENQRLFQKPSVLNDHYQGSIVNVIMNNWVTTK